MDLRIRNIDESLHSAIKIESIKQKTTLEKLVLKILEKYIKSNSK